MEAQDGQVPVQGSAAASTGEQLSLLRAHVRGERTLPARDASLALTDPVAEVLVDVPLAHLDRPFEYSVPVEMADAAVPGARVRVRFAGQDVDGYVIARKDRAEHAGRLASLRRVVSPEPVLTHAVLATCRDVARRYAGTVSDVLRLAVPPRHAAAEKALTAAHPQGAEPVRPPRPEPGGWGALRAGEALLRHLAEGGTPFACWTATPAAADPLQDWPTLLAVAATTTLSAGRGVILVVPDHRDVDRVDAALTAALGTGSHVRLTAAQGPQARYTAWLKVLRGHVRCVVGTRAAMFAPVQDLGLVAWWDDGDDLLVEPRAPYPHVREVLLGRARREGAALVAGAYARSAEVQQLVEDGVVAVVAGDGPALRRAAPRVLVAGEGPEPERDQAAAAARLPSVAWRTAKTALATGPVLVQVPRRGYAPSLACQTCRAPARCPSCHGPLALGGRDTPPRCRWCGTAVTAFECPRCEGTRLRASVIGDRRTADELGRAFPGTRVITSGAGEVVARVEGGPALVVATPGAEPVAEGGYAAALLLDAWASLDRPDLDAPLEALRRWLGAAALVRGAAAGGAVVLCGAPTDAPLPPVEALVRWDPGWLAARELAERRELALPPTTVMARVDAERHALADAMTAIGLGDVVERLGPLPAPPPPARGPRAQEPAPRHRMLLRTTPDHVLELTDALRAMRATRAARKEPEPVHVVVDPRDGLV
ncbi:primosome assembly protein PriA [Arsenicicoccus dermatophilus]|uniref:primosomal protein N' family DNA-binding protein n=1 Tax=Arsenicicoccus dermatophilus TaxID=1076331 RepID=UPI001F4C9C7E|nr:primosome assembly protein PriA [Arsenicicoccus dermatophilus]MCH8613128.1 primosome assembly protein PriA [Arsenicicoccus dermatophilus]